MPRTRPSALPRSVWGQLGGESLAAAGGGMTLLFAPVYLERVRGIDVRLAGLALTAPALAGFVGNPLGGALCDRRGARATLVPGLLTYAAGAAALALVRDPWHAVAAAMLFGLGAAIVWPAQDALLATLCGRQQLSRAFSLRYATMNAGLGAGGVLGPVIADVGSPRSFELLFGAQCSFSAASSRRSDREQRATCRAEAPRRARPDPSARLDRRQPHLAEHVPRRSRFVQALRGTEATQRGPIATRRRRKRRL